MADLFVTRDGNNVESFSAEYDAHISGTTFAGVDATVAWTRDFGFRGDIGGREIYNVRLPASMRQEPPFTREQLFDAFDAAIAFAESMAEHEGTHGCENAAACEKWG